MPNSSATVPPVVNVIDSDSDLEPEYRSIIDRLGFQLQFYGSPLDCLADQEQLTASCTVASIGEPDADVVRQTEYLGRLGADHRIIVALDKTQAELVFEVAGPNTIAILSCPIDFDSLEGLVAYAVGSRQTDLALARKYEDYRQTVEKLSERQKTILSYLTAGIPNKTIASQINVSQRTVESDRSRIVRTFGVESTFEIAMRVGEFRLLEQIHLSQVEETTHWHRITERRSEAESRASESSASISG
jgi:FixJ family two-component response regulator